PHDLFAVLTGDASLRRRPMRRVTEPLQAAGAQFWSREGGRLPLAVRGAREPMPIEYRLPVASAQVKSALLLAGLNAPGWTRIEEPEPTRDHTERMLRHFGAQVVVDQLGPGRVASLKGQPELRAADVSVPGERASSMIDEYPVLAVAAACASGVTRMHGLAELRVKESDRLSATAALLTANGVRAEIEGDTLVVHGAGGPAGGGLVVTHMDHRLAMSALVLGAGTREPVRVDDSAFIDTSFPGFAELMRGLGASIG